MNLDFILRNTFLLVGGVVLTAYLIAFHIIYALFLTKMAKIKNVGVSLLAWIPVVNMFYAAKIGEEIYPMQRFLSQTLGSAICTACLYAAGTVFQMSWLVSLSVIPFIAFLIFYFMAYYRMYNEIDPVNGTVLFLLSIFFSVIRTIIRVYYLLDMQNRKKRKIYN